ncbi:MAG: hypothetical protein ACRDTQ_12385 [Micromonosporaceae bacterium]
MSHLATVGDKLIELDQCLAVANTSGDQALTAARSALDAAQQAGSTYLIERSETLVRCIQTVQERGTEAQAAMCEAAQALREAVQA